MSGSAFTLLYRVSLPFKDTQFRPQEQLPVTYEKPNVVLQARLKAGARRRCMPSSTFLH